MYLFTETGRANAENYLAELAAKRKELIDAGKDTADDTIPATLADIICDVNDLGVDDEGEYYNGFPVTDNYDADYPLLLKLGRDLCKVDDDIYAVSQSSHGHEYVWIFDKEGLSKNCSDFERLKDTLDDWEEVCEDICWPMGGSNSSSTCIEKLTNLEAAKIFLTRTCNGPDLSDPTLIDIAEYTRTVDVEEGSITKMILDHYGLVAEALEQIDPRYDELLDAGYSPEDFYLDFRDWRYSEAI